jgi:formylglycine-generating enzyme required for sulfatase activity
VLVQVDSERLLLRDATGSTASLLWATLDECSVVGVFSEYFPEGAPRLRILMQELFRPNSVWLEMLSEALAGKDRELNTLGGSGLATPEMLDKVQLERQAILDAMFRVLGGAGKLFTEWRKAWFDASRDPASAQMVRSALAMQHIVRAAAPMLERLSYEQITELFGSGLMLDVGGGLLMNFALVPPGEFAMGSPAGQRVNPDEQPAHRVRITRPFYIALYETTNAQYAQVMTGQANAAQPDYPTTQVSWNDSTEFCRRLSLRSGLNVTLPTEAQWEYACRAGSGDPVPPRQVVDDTAWHSGNSDMIVHPVGKKHPNAWGLNDMLGNVAEWCRDWYHEDYYAHSRTDNPTGPSSGVGRSARGGSATQGIQQLAPVNRFFNAPNVVSPWVGFRAIIELGP